MKKGRTVLQSKRFGIQSCRHNAALLDATRKMVEAEVNTMIVVDDEGYLEGTISRRDVLRAHLEHDDWATHPVSQYMSRDVVTVSPTTLLHKVAEILTYDEAHQVVVVEDDNGRQRPIAVITATDLVYLILRDE